MSVPVPPAGAPPDAAPPGGLVRWWSAPMVGVALVAVTVGYAQFAPAALLGGVAEFFGERTDGPGLAEQVGLSGTALGVGLGVVRLASLAALGLATVADRVGRKVSLLWWTALGVVATVAAAGAPSYWWLVVAFALARPLLTAANILAQVLAGESTSSGQRTRALALVGASYAVGSGLVVLARTVAGGGAPFRWVLGFGALGLVAVAVAARVVVEPRRFRRLERHGLHGSTPGRVGPLLAAFAPGVRRRVVVMAVLVGAAAMVTGPANTLLFVYAENVLGVSVRFTSVLVLAAGPVGLAALLVGRALADRWGRRPTAAMGLVGMATGAALTFGGSPVALAVGYLTAMAAGSLFATPSLALANELFPTSVRATVSGWLAVVGVLGATVGLATTGVVADATGSFAVAIWVVAVPAAMAALALLGIPETRGSELEMSAPESLLGPGSL